METLIKSIEFDKFLRHDSLLTNKDLVDAKIREISSQEIGGVIEETLSALNALNEKVLPGTRTRRNSNC